MTEREDIEIVKKRRKLLQAERWESAYTKANLVKCHTMLKWLVANNITDNLQRSRHAAAYYAGNASTTRGYWIKWKKLDQFAGDFCDYLSSKQRILKNGEQAMEAVNNLAPIRSAMAQIRTKAMSIEHVQIDPWRIQQYEDIVGGFMLGVKKREKKLQSRGLLPLDTGGRAFPLSLYKETCKRFLQVGDSKRLLMHILSLQTMGRNQNISDIQTNHFQWWEDATRVTFPISKTRKTDDTRNVWMHFFGNPYCPSEDINLAFGLYFLTETSGPGRDSKRIFPGGKKVAAGLAVAVKNLYKDGELGQKFGLEKEELKNHDYRRTGLSIMSMGKCEQPNGKALDFRAGHNTNFWQTHAYYDPTSIENLEGDYLIGRLFIGDPGTKEFKALPAHFKDANKPIIQAALAICCVWFSRTDIMFQRCLKRYIAAVVFHSDWLEKTLPDHPIHQTPLFQRDGLLSSLKAELGNIDDGCLKLHGVTSWKYAVSKTSETLKTHVKGFKDTVKGAMQEVLETSGGISRGNQSSKNCSEDQTLASIKKTVKNLEMLVKKQIAVKEKEKETTNGKEFEPFAHDGNEFRAIPPGWKIKGGTKVPNAWIHWWSGKKITEWSWVDDGDVRKKVKKVMRIKPYRDLTLADDLFGDQWKQQRKCISVHKKVIEYVSAKLTQLDTPTMKWREDPTDFRVINRISAHVIPQLYKDGMRAKAKINQANSEEVDEGKEVDTEKALSVSYANQLRLAIKKAVKLKL